jgi:hypothetical protein
MPLWKSVENFCARRWHLAGAFRQGQSEDAKCDYEMKRRDGTKQQGDCQGGGYAGERHAGLQCLCG